MDDRPLIDRARMARLSFLLVCFLLLAFFVDTRGITVLWLVLAGIVVWKMNTELKRAHISVVPTKAAAWILAGIIATVLLLVLLGLFLHPTGT